MSAVFATRDILQAVASILSRSSQPMRHLACFSASRLCHRAAMTIRARCHCPAMLLERVLVKLSRGENLSASLMAAGSILRRLRRYQVIFSDTPDYQTLAVEVRVLAADFKAEL